MGDVRVDGRRIAFERVGEGPPLLLLHGGMSCSSEWRHQLAGLAPHLDVIAWDCPGCGRSDDPGEAWSLEDFATCAWGLVTALGLDDVHVAGLSFGGGLALAMHDQAPARVRSLALLSAYAGWKGSLEPADVAQRLAACLAPRGPVHPDEAAAFVGPDAPADLLEEVMALEVGTTALGAAVQGRAFAEADLRAVLPTLRVPTLVVRGEHDARCPAPVTQAIAAAVPGSRLVVVAGVGHCLDLEAPSEVNRLLLGHVRAAERSARSQ